MPILGTGCLPAYTVRRAFVPKLSVLMWSDYDGKFEGPPRVLPVECPTCGGPTLKATNACWYCRAPL